MQTRTLLTGIAALTVCGVASADVVTPVSVNYAGSASSAGGGINLDTAENIINGNGLSATPAADESDIATITHAGVSFAAPGNAWATDDPAPGGGDWFGAGGSSGTVVFEFNLGGTFTIDSIVSWGYFFAGSNGNSISEVTLDFSTNGGVSTDSSQTVAISLESGGAASISAIAATSANHITMTVTDNHFGNAAATEGGGDRVGIAEIRFTDNVPEPGSLALLGLGGLMITRRRRA